MQDAQELTGGRESIYRVGDSVYRPLQPWSSTIHNLLNQLQAAGLNESPKFIGIDGDQEMLSFVAGDTYNYPLTNAIASTEALISAAKLLRKIHDASVGFVQQENISSFTWMLPPQEPYEVICHGDFAPYNVALTGNLVTGVFDFDTAHPAPRVWDLAYSLYCWAPFKTNSDDKLGTLEEQISRAKLFCDSYGTSEEQKKQIPDFMIKRLNALVNFMRREANKGNQQFCENIDQGHLKSYLRDIEYIESNKPKILSGLCN